MTSQISAKAIILRPDGKLLALHRTETAPSNPLSWDFPGGVIDEGENIESGLIREIKEEADIEVKNLGIIDLHSRTDEAGKLHIQAFYFAETKSENITLSWEHDKFQWVAPEEFLKLKASEKLKSAVKKLNKIILSNERNTR